MHKPHYFLAKPTSLPCSPQSYLLTQPPIPQDISIIASQQFLIALQKSVIKYTVKHDSQDCISFISGKQITVKALCLDQSICLINSRKIAIFNRHKQSYKFSLEKRGNYYRILKNVHKVLRNISQSSQNYLLVSQQNLTLLELANQEVKVKPILLENSFEFSLCEVNSFICLQSQILLCFKILLVFLRNDLTFVAKVPLFQSIKRILSKDLLLYIQTQDCSIYELKCSEVQHYEHRKLIAESGSKLQIEEMLKTMEDLSFQEQFQLVQNLANQEKSRLTVQLEKLSLKMVMEGCLEKESRVTGLMVVYLYFKPLECKFKLLCVLIQQNQNENLLFQRISYNEQLNIILHSLQEQEQSEIKEWELPLKYAFLTKFTKKQYTCSLIMILSELSELTHLFGQVLCEFGEIELTRFAKEIKRRQLVSNLFLFYQVCSHYNLKKEDVWDPQV